MASKLVIGARILFWLVISIFFSLFLIWFLAIPTSLYFVLVLVLFVVLVKFDHDRGYHIDWKILGAISLFLILGLVFVFMNILCCTDPASSPYDLVQDSLSRISSKGFGVDTPGAVTLGQGYTLLKKDVVKGMHVDGKDVSFFCSNCGSLTVTPDGVSASAQQKAYLTVCGDETSNFTPKYCVAFDVDSEQGAIDLCMTSCRIN